MAVTKLPPRDKRLTQMLERRIAEDDAWARFQCAINRYHEDPSPARHVAAHDARRAWERTS